MSTTTVSIAPAAAGVARSSLPDLQGPVRIAVDCMGGDHGPEVTLPACRAFLDQNPEASLILVGLPDVLARFSHPRARVVTASEVVAMDDPLEVALRNDLPEATTIHWHGILLPYQMDGVPMVSFAGIKPGETFTYRFKVRQSGTYWYHSHSGLQEQEGHYAPIIIDPAGPDPVAFDREHVVVLSDYSFTHPHRLFQKLKQEAGVFNYRKQTIAGLLAGKDQSFGERMAWSKEFKNWIMIALDTQIQTLKV